jgi:hypothetical protein
MLLNLSSLTIRAAALAQKLGQQRAFYDSYTSMKLVYKMTKNVFYFL